MNEIRTRFAVSPTGMIHIGAVRSAIYDWLFAKNQKGKLILRIEDTDKAREVEGGVQNIIDSLKWLGLNWDEGPDVGGEHAPYTQSERLDIYKKYAQELIDKGYAYADPYTPDEVEEFRREAQKAKKPFLYRNHRPANPPEWDGTMPLRLKVPELKSYSWNDEVRGELSAGPEALDDIVLIKSDGYPTYNYCHIVDDKIMGITHVIRADEFIASVPKYLSIYEAFDWKPPIFVTLPPILGKDGNKKLSKRDGAQSVLEYRDQGYLPETLVNFLVLLGWNDGTEKEIFTIPELIQRFSLNRIQKSPARFDQDRLNWISSQHIRHLTIDELAEKSQPFWPKIAKKSNQETMRRILTIEQERLKNFGELDDLPEFYFQEPKLKTGDLNEIPTAELKAWINEICQIITTTGSSDREKLETHIREAIGKQQSKPGALFGSLRIALTNAERTPPIWDLVYVLGVEESVRRLEKALALL